MAELLEYILFMCVIGTVIVWVVFLNAWSLYKVFNWLTYERKKKDISHG